MTRSQSSGPFTGQPPQPQKAHASGDYSICDAQLNDGLLGDWD